MLTKESAGPPVVTLTAATYSIFFPSLRVHLDFCQNFDLGLCLDNYSFAIKQVSLLKKLAVIKLLADQIT